MHSRARTLLLVIGLTVGPLGVANAGTGGEQAATQAARTTPKFRVEPMGPSSLPAEFAERLATAAGTGLTAAGGDVLVSEGTPDYLLRGTCSIEGSTYRLHLELVDARTHVVAAGRDDLCEICTETEAAEATNVAASALKIALEGSLRAAPPTPSPLVQAKPAAPDTRAVAPWRRALPWVAFGVGAAALGAGVYFLAMNGKGTDPYPATHDNANLYDTTWRYTVPSLGVAAAATVVGILTLPRAARRGAESSPAPRAEGLTLTPSGLAAWGTF